VCSSDLPATVDRLRSFGADPEEGAAPIAVTLAATDPANPYGAALGWPSPPTPAGTAADAEPRAADRASHRPGRKAGALATLVDGALEVYVERGGKSVLTFSSDPDHLRAAAESLAATVRRSGGRLRIEKIDGAFGVGTPFGEALVAAGFAPTPQGLRLRA
jgi:ATP-dependent Lhr-like helicase